MPEIPAEVYAAVQLTASYHRYYRSQLMIDTSLAEPELIAISGYEAFFDRANDHMRQRFPNSTIGIRTRLCSSCGDNKPVGDFPKSGRKCKFCVSLYYKLWREKNKEMALESSKRWKEKNPGSTSATTQKWRESHSDETKIQNSKDGKKWREKNREKRAQYMREYRKRKKKEQ